MPSSSATAGSAKRLPAVERPFLPEFHVAAYRKMRKQAGFLKDHAEGALVGWHEMSAGLVLPDRVAQRKQAARRPFEAGHGAQAGRLARPGRAEQGRDAGPGQGQVDIDREVVAVNPESRPDFGRHGAFRRAGLKV